MPCSPSAISIHAPSRERRMHLEDRSCVDVISIHAPSRERLFAKIYTHVTIYNFNPRSLAGATIVFNLGALANIHFNPRSLAGATRHYLQRLLAVLISIHAPSRERLMAIMIVRFDFIFQSTLPRGSDNVSPIFYTSIILFQSTLPRGSDPIH